MEQCRVRGHCLQKLQFLIGLNEVFNEFINNVNLKFKVTVDVISRFVTVKRVVKLLIRDHLDHGRLCKCLIVRLILLRDEPHQLFQDVGCFTEIRLLAETVDCQRLGGWCPPAVGLAHHVLVDRSRYTLFRLHELDKLRGLRGRITRHEFLHGFFHVIHLMLRPRLVAQVFRLGLEPRRVKQQHWIVHAGNVVNRLFPQGAFD